MIILENSCNSISSNTPNISQISFPIFMLFSCEKKDKKVVSMGHSRKSLQGKSTQNHLIIPNSNTSGSCIPHTYTIQKALNSIKLPFSDILKLTIDFLFKTHFHFIMFPLVSSTKLKSSSSENASMLSNSLRW